MDTESTEFWRLNAARLAHSAGFDEQLKRLADLIKLPEGWHLRPPWNENPAEHWSIYGCNGARTPEIQIHPKCLRGKSEASIQAGIEGVNELPPRLHAFPCDVMKAAIRLSEFLESGRLATGSKEPAS